MKNIICAAALVLTLTGCASGNLSSEAAQLEVRKYNVPAGKASIYVYRPNQIEAAAVLINVYLNGELIAVLGPGNFVRMDLRLGRHAIVSRGGESEGIVGSILTSIFSDYIQPPIPANTVINVRPNRKYFLGTRHVTGWVTNSIKHELVGDEQGMNDLKRSRMVETF